MIGKFKINPHYTTAERFICQKLLEGVYYRTLDSHRAKLNNPCWILVELNQVLRDLELPAIYGRKERYRGVPELESGA